MWFAEVWSCNIWSGFVCVWMSWLDANLLWQDHDEKQLRLSNSLSTLVQLRSDEMDATQIRQLFNESFLKRRLSVRQPDCCVKWTAHAFFGVQVMQTLALQILLLRCILNVKSFNIINKLCFLHLHFFQIPFIIWGLKSPEWVMRINCPEGGTA